jgi:hypothetical protein
VLPDRIELSTSPLPRDPVVLKLLSFGGTIHSFSTGYPQRKCCLTEDHL